MTESIEKIELPSWVECSRKYGRGKANPLELFIYHNEPAGLDDIAFREQLTDLIRWFGENLIKTMVDEVET